MNVLDMHDRRVTSLIERIVAGSPYISTLLDLRTPQTALVSIKRCAITERTPLDSMFGDEEMQTFPKHQTSIRAL